MVSTVMNAGPIFHPLQRPEMKRHTNIRQLFLVVGRATLLALLITADMCDTQNLSDTKVNTSSTASEKHIKEELRVLVLLPANTGGVTYPFGVEMSGSAVLKALDDISQGPLLTNYTINANFANTGCNAHQGIGTAHEMLHAHRYDAIFGPACSQVCRFVGRLAAYLNIPVFSGVCQGTEMLNKNDFKTLTRLLGTFEMTGLAVSNFVMHFGWTRVGIIAEQYADIIWILTNNGLQYALMERNITVAISSVVHGDDVEKALIETARVSRTVQGETFRRAMEVAYRNNLHNGDYIFVSIPFYKLPKLFGDFTWEQGDDVDNIVKAVYPSVFFFWYYNREDSEEKVAFEQYVRNQSAQSFQYHYTEKEEVPYPAANLYEAAMLYALAVNETLDEGGDIRDGVIVAQRLWNRSFSSLTGGVTLNSNGDRDQAYLVTHMQDTEQGKVEAIATYYSSNSTLILNTPRILWPGGLTDPPLDTPECGFDGALCREDPYAKLSRIIGIFSGTLIATMILAVIIVFFVCRRLRFEREIADMKWKIDIDEITMSKAVGTSHSRVSLKAVTGSKDSLRSTGQHFALIGTFKGLLVAIKRMERTKEVDLSDKKFLASMSKLYYISHPNLVRFVGVSIQANTMCIITEYCTKGSLEDVLENEDIQLDWAFKCSLLFDIIEGLKFLEGGHLHCHGNFKSSNCLVDGRFVVKLTDFGLPEWRAESKKQAKDLLWTAPEFLDLPNPGATGNAKGDIYSLGIVLQEIVAREGPFFVTGMSLGAEEKIRRVTARESPPFRPETTASDCPTSVIDLMNKCWDDLPSNRPSLSEVKLVVKAASGTKGKSLNIFDMLLSRMEHYADNLESLVEERTGRYLEEKKRAEALLHRLLPSSVAQELQVRGQVDPVTHESVTIYFSDIVEFTPLCSESTPLQVVDLLNDLYTCFDGVIARFDVYKVETIGDAYMAVSGLPTANGNLHSREICLMSLALLHSVTNFRIGHRPDKRLLLRIGIHSGPCVAGVVGLTMPRYCLFGDTVNTAARMESNGMALKIHLSPDTYKLLQVLGGFTVESRGDIMIKGKGWMETFWLLDGPNDKRLPT